MTPRTALGALHIGALMFGLTGVFGKLAAASASVIVLGRAGFAVIALACFASLSRQSRWHPITLKDARNLLLSGLLLAAHWDAAFDRGLVSFDDQGRALVKPTLSEAALALLAPERARLLPLDHAHRRQLAWHRERFGFMS